MVLLFSSFNIVFPATQGRKQKIQLKEYNAGWQSITFSPLNTMLKSFLIETFDIFDEYIGRSINIQGFKYLNLLNRQ